MNTCNIVDQRDPQGNKCRNMLPCPVHSPREKSLVNHKVEIIIVNSQNHCLVYDTETKIFIFQGSIQEVNAWFSLKEKGYYIN